MNNYSFVANAPSSLPQLLKISLDYLMLAIQPPRYIVDENMFYDDDLIVAIYFHDLHPMF